MNGEENSGRPAKDIFSFENLHAAYQSMAADSERETDAIAWIEGCLQETPGGPKGSSKLPGAKS